MWLGTVSEYIGRICEEVEQRHRYAIEAKNGFDSP